MVNKYGELRRPQSRLLLCTTIIVVEKLYAFARHNFPNAAERGPFDDDNIIYGFHRVGPFSNRRTPLIWREVVNDPRLGWFNQEEVKWLKAFRHANNFFCDPLVVCLLPPSFHLYLGLSFSMNQETQRTSRRRRWASQQPFLYPSIGGRGTPS